LVVTGLRFIAHSGGVVASPDPGGIISGASRDSFVAAGMDTCLKKQENDPDNQSASLSKEALRKYCSCYMNALADTVTYGDLKGATQGGPMTSAMQKKVDAPAASCRTKLLRTLLGG
jgi:hypothetical protein